MAASAKAAATRPSATGASRRVATARSTEQNASSAEMTATGSGRSPLLNGSQNIRKTIAAAHPAAADLRTCWPRRGSISREISSQDTMPMNTEGRRIHRTLSLTWTQTA